MRRLFLSGFLLSALFAWGAGPAQAQIASVAGTVQDETGGVLPGVTVSAANEETGLLRTGFTDDVGTFRLLALPPGTYTVTVELAGFTTEVRKGLVLAIDQTATLRLTLRTAAIEETVTVVGASAIVDVTRSEVFTVVSERQIENLPLSARRWVDLAMVVPGASQDGLRGDSYRGNVNIGGGSRFYTNMFLVDGLNNNWAQQGEPRQDYGMDAIREFKVHSASYKAEYGLAIGGILSVVTKSGTNVPHGSAFLFYRDDSLTALEHFQETKPPYMRRQYGGSIGGPVVKDRTHFFFSYERTDEDQYGTVEAGGLWPDYEGTFLAARYFQDHTVRIDQQLPSNQSLFVRYSDNRRVRPLRTLGGSVSVPGAVDGNHPAWSIVSGHTWVIGNRAINEFRFQRGFNTYTVGPPNSVLGPGGGKFRPDDFGEQRLSMLTPEFRYPSILIGSSNSQNGREVRWQFKDDFSFTAGPHEWKLGGDYTYVDFAAGTTTGLANWTFPLDRPYDPNDPLTYPTQYSSNLPRYAHNPSHYFAFYLQDDWSVRRNVTLNLGLRYDVQIGAFNENLPDLMRRVENVLGPGFDFPLPVPFHEGADQRGDRNNLGPRIGVAWDVGGNGTTNVHGAYGLFYNWRRVLQNHGEITWPQARQIIIRNPSFPDPLQGQSRDAFVSTAPPNINVLSNDAENPQSHHVSLGITQQLRPNLGVSVEGTYQAISKDDLTVDVNLPDPVTRVRPYPQFARVSMNQSLLEGAYKALMVKVDKRLSDGYQFLASYTLASNEDWPVSNTSADTYGYVRLKGPSASDRRHRLVLSGMVDLPRNMMLSAIADFRTSLPFNPTTSLDLNNDGYTGDLPPGVGYRTGCRGLNVDAINAFRASRRLPEVSESGIECPNYANVDLRFTKAWVIRGGHQIALISQLLNVFNRPNFDFVAPNPGSGIFGQVTRIIPFFVNAPSRQVEFALRYQF